MDKLICILKTICFFSGLIIVLRIANNIIKYKEPYGIVQYEGFYEQERNTIDVLFMGTSHVYSDIDPAYVYDQNGVLSYDLASGGAGIWCTYYSLKQALEYQKPKVIVVEIMGAILGDYGMSRRQIVDATYMIKNPRIKYDELKLLCKASNYSMPEMWLAFPWYHGLYSDVDKYDFSEYSNTIKYNNGSFSYLYDIGDISSYKGATTLQTIYPFEQQIDANAIVEQEEISERSYEYIKK